MSFPETASAAGTASIQVHPRGEGGLMAEGLRYLASPSIGLPEGPLPPSPGLLRARITAGEPFTRVLAGAGLVPATDEVFSFARWITPITNPRRWDTRFLVGRAPRGQEPAVDGTETV